MIPLTDQEKREFVERVARKRYQASVAILAVPGVRSVPIWDRLSNESKQLKMAIAAEYLDDANYFELIDLLLDCWVQFALRDDNGWRFHGSLSILEDLESMLFELGLIDENGLLESERAALKGRRESED